MKISGRASTREVDVAQEVDIDWGVASWIFFVTTTFKLSENASNALLAKFTKPTELAYTPLERRLIAFLYESQDPSFRKVGEGGLSIIIC